MFKNLKLTLRRINSFPSFPFHSQSPLGQFPLSDNTQSLLHGNTYQEVIQNFKIDHNPSNSETNQWHDPNKYYSPSSSNRNIPWPCPPNQIHFNIAHETIDRHAILTPKRPALITHDGEKRFCFQDVSEWSRKLLSALSQLLNANKLDRIGILLDQSVETIISHTAVYNLGGIVIPLFTLFGVDALEYRLNHSSAKIIITDSLNFEEKLVPLIESNKIPHLEAVVVTTDFNNPNSGSSSSKQLPPSVGNVKVFSFWEIISTGTMKVPIVHTYANSPALQLYTSGTTGSPKACLHSHSVLLGHLPGMEFAHDLFPSKNRDHNMFWTCAPVSWIGGLFDCWLTSLFYGIPVIMQNPAREKADPTFWLDLLATHPITATFLPPTALKLIAEVPEAQIRSYRSKMSLKTIGTGGEPLGSDTLEWCEKILGVNVNEFYGMSEVNLVLSNSKTLFPIVPGSMGKPVPGHNVQIVSDDGTLLGPNKVGNISIEAPNPCMFLGYSGDPEATKEKFVDTDNGSSFLLSGDLGSVDDDGYFWFHGRADDIILTAGYRVGPAEVEKVIQCHPGVLRAAVIGVPDPLRYQKVKAFIKVQPGITEGEELKTEIQQYCKSHLSSYSYPREIEFIDEFPQTVTGKIMRRELRKK